MLIFLYGDDTFRSRKKLKELKEKFVREVDPNADSLIVLDGENTDVNKINAATATTSLFSRKRMIIIERILGNKSKTILDQIAEYLGTLKENNDNIIIFWDEVGDDKKAKNKLFQFLSKQKFAQNFNKLSGNETTNWIRSEVESRGAKIDPRACFSLAGMFSGDLWQLDNEINKLINYKQGQDIFITEQDAKDLVVGSVDENIFGLMDAISQKNKALAFQLLEKELEAGVAEGYLLTMLMRQFRILLQVRDCLDREYAVKKITAQLKLHPFVIQKSITQAKNFSLSPLKVIFEKLVDLDKQMKSGQTDLKSAIGLIIAKI